MVVAVLSPRMVYSMTEWPRMRATALSEGFGVVAWWSPDLTGNEGAAAAEKAGWTTSDMANVTQVPSECVASVGRPNHYPFSVVLDRWKVHDWPIWGVMPDQAWVDSLHWRLFALRRPVEGFLP